jgi:hypothetical protein
MRATGRLQPTEHSKIPPKRDVSAADTDVLVSQPYLVEGGAQTRPDYMLIRQSVVEIFEATLNSEFKDTQKTYAQKLEQFAKSVPWLAREFADHRIVYSVVTPRRLRPETQERILEELTQRTKIPVQVVWRVVA